MLCASRVLKVDKCSPIITLLEMTVSHHFSAAKIESMRKSRRGDWRGEVFQVRQGSEGIHSEGDWPNQSMGRDS